MIPMKATLLIFAVLREAVGMDAVKETARLRAVALTQREDPPLPKMPKAGNPFAPIKDGGKTRVMDAINKFRAEVCYRMKVDHGVEFGTYENCEKFMKKACNPGRDRKMDGDNKEVTSGEGYCKEFFPEAERKAKEQIEEEDRAAVVLSAPSPGPATPAGIVAPAPAPAVVTPPPAPAPVQASPVEAPPKPDYIPGRSQGKPKEKLGDDEAYYYKKGGKDAMRLHMDENMKLPTQGYWGKLVSHDDMETATGDWGEEFGAKANLGSYESHCKRYCDNDWCIRRGYCKDKSKNSFFKNSSVAACGNVFLAIVLAMRLLTF